ncbi:hypothetical protein BDK51DRAFT_47834 [Blyttiomyces helicus]|uniref:U1-type domain-containing protein n=1 Tax=Blyttiomyces helicus TaxID=388810 RepID=A0A4P9WGZ1_9FUNG|nr:hypothetical protein BDK51DRAFT_47834 [Blyttiomyces helicus]|eukprot:RKO91205.1 hypothetical protein BDK51DRAFT_47834 [Blyttiomyces helicus]
MSEFWSRTTHENGKKHKEAVQAFLRGVNKRTEARAAEEKKTKSMMLEIEKAALKQYAHDVGAPERPSSSAALPTPSVPTPAAVSSRATAAPRRTATPPPSEPPRDPTTVEVKSESGPRAMSALVEDEEEEGEGSAGLRQFKVVEKKLAVLDDGADAGGAVGGVVFKKRKVGAAKTGRNVRSFGSLPACQLPPAQDLPQRTPRRPSPASQPPPPESRLTLASLCVSVTVARVGCCPLDCWNAQNQNSPFLRRQGP